MFQLIPYNAVHASAVVRLLNVPGRSQQAVIDGVGNVRLIRYLPPACPKVVAVNEQEEIVGFAYLTNREQYIVYEMGGGVHPAYWGMGIGRQLIHWAEAEGQLLSAQAPAGIKTVLQTNLYPDNREALRLFVANGYAKVREWLHLVIEFSTPPPWPTVPAGFHLRPMDLDNDWELVGPAMDEAFANHWGAISLPPNDQPAINEEASEAQPEDESYSNAPGFCFLILDQERVAGAILCNAKLVNAENSGRVGSLFVRPGYRRQGLGQILMQAAFHTFWQHGLHRVITDTDATSFSHTPRFYAKLAMSQYQREFLYEKELRPGQEIRRLTSDNQQPFQI